MHNSQKKVLVMMSTYNGEEHLQAQIESILNQKIEHNVLLRIRDDGSTDKTCDIIKKYMSYNPGKIELIEGENIGYNRSFFSLIKNACGFDYYAISDQDDVWLDDKLQIACNAIDDCVGKGPVLYASTSFLVHNDLIPYGTTRKRQRTFSVYNTIIQNICPGHTQVMNNELLSLLKDNIDISNIYVYDSWITNTAILYGSLIFDNRPHTYYRQHENNQLGAGSGFMSRLINSFKRINVGDGHAYKKQAEYFINLNKDELQSQGLFENLQSFAAAKSLNQRISVVVMGKLFRQSALETVAFYLAYLMGKY